MSDIWPQNIENIELIQQKGKIVVSSVRRHETFTQRPPNLKFISNRNWNSHSPAGEHEFLRPAMPILLRTYFTASQQLHQRWNPGFSLLNFRHRAEHRTPPPFVPSSLRGCSAEWLKDGWHDRGFVVLSPQYSLVWMSATLDTISVQEIIGAFFF